MSDPIMANEFDVIRNANTDNNGLIVCPVVPLANIVIYPNIITPVTIPEGRALAAVRAAAGSRQTAITLMATDTTNPTPEQLHKTGTEVALGQILPFPENQKTVLTQGRRRVEIVEFLQTDPYIIAKARILEAPEIPDNAGEEYDEQLEALMQTALNLFQTAGDLSETIPDEVIDYAMTIEEPGWMADFIASTLSLSPEERQRLLEMIDPMERLREVAVFLSRELNMLELRDEINGQIQQEMNRNQREMYLREQMRVIQTELGEEDVFQQEITEVRQLIIDAKLPQDIHEKALKELARLSIMPPMAPEVGIIRTYIDWLVALPWNKKTEDNLDMSHAQKVLDEEHYGLKKIKDRILEHIAVRKLAAEKMKTPILCFVGPPGVGKTSLGKSIAKALGREFVRVSLGGVRDEAEIRGHRRTYIGALPGRIIQTMRRAGTVNPIFMLDEIDKIGADFRGDPSAALLEVLDPEQNSEYSDHYLDIPYDLSQVMFITTANDLEPLPPALLDRLEVIEFPGYTEEEKLAIAREFLIPDQLEGHGLDNRGLKFEADALKTMIRQYTYEAGVRNLNREIANVCRKVARLVAEEKTFPKRITSQMVTKFLGPPEFLPTRANEVDSVGLATGLAWTYGGGDTLTIEVSILPGKGSLLMTGQLGEVMQESAQAAMSYMRSRAADLNVPTEDFEDYDVHVHLPEGAVPKDGPSAGITLAAAIISAFTERKIRSSFAMTGEITLRGRVLPVGGIKEKVLSAHRARIKNVILPAHNKKDLVDIPANATRGLNIHFVEDMQQVMDLVLLEAPAERERDKLRAAEEAKAKQKDKKDSEGEKKSARSRKKKAEA
jgi:ATP-dependent Lon protease